MSRKTMRLWLVSHEDGRKSGYAMRSWDSLFDQPVPSAYGATEAEVRAAIERTLAARIASGEDTIDRYLWDETFHVSSVLVDVAPLSFVEKQPVVGSRTIPLRVRYAWSRVESGAIRVMLPRLGMWLLLEDLEGARAAIQHVVAGGLLGAAGRALYELREEPDEVVREWDPELTTHTTTAEDAEVHHAPPTLRAIAEDLTARATAGRLPQLVGDDPTFDATVPELDRDRPPSLLLVGGEGVGKTSFVQRFAKRLASQRRGGNKRGRPRLWSTSRDRILAGMTYLGMWQERCLSLVEELASSGDLLHVDRLLALLERQHDGSSIAEVLGPAIVAGEIRVVAECTESELEECRRRAGALVDAFRVVRIDEPSRDAMPAFLSLYQQRVRGPAFHPEAWKRLVRHLDAYQRHQRFPGKGVRFLDWMARHTASTESTATRVYPSDVSRAFARFSGLPLELLDDDVAFGSAKIAGALRARVIGQDDACATAARVLARFKAGMNDPERPLGSLLFVGSTGVGKTELAKQIARFLFGSEERMIRVDMSEYLAPGSAPRLLASTPGASSLADRVRKEPLSLVLLDEIEKAHPEVFDLLLGVLGEGRLTDSLGRLVDFRMSLVVMTSNLGASEPVAPGFGAALEPDFERAVRSAFRPELFNRIDRVVRFRNLAHDDLLRIVDLELASAAKRTGLVRRAITLDVDADARTRLAELGWHRARGARPLRRVIEERVVTPIAVLLAGAPELRDRTMRVRAERGEITVALGAS
ncbi:AAA family ATPase [Sandaracinus amylolyticus]|uniref:ATP-dependent Clp protease ATP-binding subunit ClpA n=1 Tax=Sandaracinus amylolyticus TaxID=927083 RepID=A0A0F6W5E0_9BACT|nr:AAA family ATPase [Sandaracinus amylolyticus]AKF07733.1 ATP-dependent Clp protease ATP-binding subunit ClpA [Sandaracinus amylolyticus]